MAGAGGKPLKAVAPAISEKERPGPLDVQLKSRESQELVIAISGPIGSGQKDVVDEIRTALKSFGYESTLIKLSEFIRTLASAGKIDGTTGERLEVDALQTAGNNLRTQYDDAVLAKLAIAHIAAHRLKSQGPQVSGYGDAPAKHAWIIDQLKHPAEAAVLRQIYGNLFFLLGIFSSEEQRRKRLLLDVSATEANVRKIMGRDRNENDAHGQKLEKTLQHADYFVRNSGGIEHIATQVRRFVSLIHGCRGLTPNTHEAGMYAAYSASLRSACLSRQVGASIVDTLGNVISTGCNDVPKAHGGLYTSDDGNDDRCVHKGLCFNDLHKAKIQKEVKDRLLQLDIQEPQASRIASDLRENTRIKDLIEFSRSVHAEMDAIVTLARNGGPSSRGCTLYTTTFPCHSCARHILAAGIVRVFYFEPYEKSLALDLHGNDIAFDEPSELSTRKVNFLHFEGVAPKRFHTFFYASTSRKDKNGKAINRPAEESRKIATQYLDSYVDYEKKVAQELSDEGLISLN